MAEKRCHGRRQIVEARDDPRGPDFNRAPDSTAGGSITPCPGCEDCAPNREVAGEQVELHGGRFGKSWQLAKERLLKGEGDALAQRSAVKFLEQAEQRVRSLDAILKEEHAKLKGWVEGGMELERRAEAAESRLAEVEGALPDPEKLELLADWLDMKDAQAESQQGNDVQRDLRHWAQLARLSTDKGEA